MARTSKAQHVDSEAVPQKRVRADRLNLTDDERALLADPEWVTEDDADAIVAKRREREGSVSFEEVLRENGIRLEH